MRRETRTRNMESHITRYNQTILTRCVSPFVMILVGSCLDHRPRQNKFRTTSGVRASSSQKFQNTHSTSSTGVIERLSHQRASRSFRIFKSTIMYINIILVLYSFYDVCTIQYRIDRDHLSYVCLTSAQNLAAWQSLEVMTTCVPGGTKTHQQDTLR